MKERDLTDLEAKSLLANPDTCPFDGCGGDLDTIDHNSERTNDGFYWYEYDTCMKCGRNYRLDYKLTAVEITD